MDIGYEINIKPKLSFYVILIAVALLTICVVVHFARNKSAVSNETEVVSEYTPE